MALTIVVGAGCGLGVVGTEPPSTPPPTSPSDAAPSDGPLPMDASADGPDADCLDLSTDARNCGQCGHSCLGGTCAAGVCQPFTVVSGVPDVSAIAVDATFLYYAQHTAANISKVPLAGGAPVLVYDTTKAPHDLVLHVDRVYWADQLEIGLYVFGAPSGVTKAYTGGVHAIAWTADGLYGVTNAGIEDVSLDLAGTVQSLTNTGASPAIVTDATHAYWSAGKEIRRVPLGGAQGAIEAVVTGLSADPTSMAIDGTRVYWTTGAAVETAVIAAGTGWPIVKLVSGETTTAALELDATRLYWVDIANGDLRAAPIAGGAAITLVKAMPQRTDVVRPRLVAVSPDAVYYASTNDGAVYGLAK